jgi:ribosome maturation factor RimP
VTDPRARLTTLLAPVVQGVGADLEDLQVSPAGRRRLVRVVVDKDGGVSLDDVADVSRVLSEALDDIDAREPALLEGAYVLEVSSPGVDRPLTLARHWRRNAGRLVQASLRAGGSVTGRVVRVDGDGDDARVVLSVDGAERELALTELSRGTVQVEFDRKGGPDEAQLDDDADDEIDDDDDEQSDDDGEQEAR